MQLENNLTTLQEFLAKKAKARQATNSSHTNLTPNAAAHAKNFKGEDDRGKEINRDYKVTQLWRGKFFRLLKLFVVWLVLIGPNY